MDHIVVCIGSIGVCIGSARVHIGSARLLKGTNTQHSGHVGQIFKTEKTIEIQPVRPTEICGEV